MQVAAALLFCGLLTAADGVRVGQPLAGAAKVPGLAVHVPGTLQAEARSALERDGVRIVPGATGALFAEDGIVRRVLKAPQSKWADEIISWRNGKLIYRDMCSRCHGEDGNDTSYSGIRPLGGLGNRLTDERIIELTSGTNKVDLHALSAADKRALGIYVAGL